MSNNKLLLSLITTSRLLRSDPPTQVLVMLLGANLEVDGCTDDKYRTPLHLACKYGIGEFIR